MSDNNQSGAPSATPGANASEPAAFGSFGTTRGAGLARGKRPAAAAPSAAPAAPSGYKPSSLEVITTKSEYVNPFTGETAVDAPRANEPVPQAAPVPVVAPAPVAYVAPAPASVKESAPVVSAPALAASKRSEDGPTSTGDLFPLDGPAAKSAPAEKAELNILPTVEPKRPAVSWETGSSDAAPSQRRDDRGTFRTERNRREGGEPREAREGREGKPFEPREPRRDERKFEPRDKQPYQPRDPRDERPDRAPRAETPAPAKKSGGFFGWLKGLFGGKTAETPATGGGERRSDRDGDQGGRRRHRGGRGRNRGGFQGGERGGQPFQHRDPRDEPQGESRGGGDQQQGESRGDGYEGGGGGRRRRRGGRGRFRGEGGGGDNRGPRPEGQQGGGAI